MRRHLLYLQKSIGLQIRAVAAYYMEAATLANCLQYDITHYMNFSTRIVLSPSSYLMLDPNPIVLVLLEVNIYHVDVYNVSSFRIVCFMLTRIIYSSCIIDKFTLIRTFIMFVPNSVNSSTYLMRQFITKPITN